MFAMRWTLIRACAGAFHLHNQFRHLVVDVVLITQYSLQLTVQSDLILDSSQWVHFVPVEYYGNDGNVH